MSAHDVDTPCANWTGYVMDSGYGRDYIKGTGYGHANGRDVLAHRQVWEEARGPIPDGMQVHHRCENKRCVNLEHLELLERRVHTSMTHGSGLTRETAGEIRSLALAGWRGCDIAVAYDVSSQTVCNIKKGRHWA